MDYGKAKLAERLAAEYSLGTLRGRARRRFEQLLPAHPVLRTATARWRQRLAPLASPVAPVTPPPQVWRAIESQLFGAAPVAPPWWQRLALWRGATALAGCLALGLAVITIQVSDRQAGDAAPIVVVMASNDKPGGQQLSFVASVSADGRALVIKPLQPISLEAQKVLQLWALPAAGSPRSLGLLTAAGTARLERASLLQDTAAFAVSIEPPGGAPGGAPTGPVVSVGKLEI